MLRDKETVKEIEHKVQCYLRRDKGRDDTSGTIRAHSGLEIACKNFHGTFSGEAKVLDRHGS